MKAVLRDYQREALDKFLDATHGTLAIFPGGGKTIIACAAIERVGRKALVITPTRELVEQWGRALREQGIRDTTVVTYALAIRRPEEWFRRFGIIVYDESHHLVGEVFKTLLIPAHIADYALGLTATPPGATAPSYQPDERRFFRAKRPGALKREQEPLSLQVLPVLYTRTFEQGRAEGSASPITFSVVRVELSEPERVEYGRLSEEIKAVISKAGSLDRAVAWRGDLFTKRKMLVGMAREKFDKLVDIVRRINEEDNEPDRLFVWAEYIEALERADAALKRAGVKSRLVHGGLPKAERAKAFEDWGRRFQVLLIAKLGEEGLDVPTVAHGVLVAGARTTRQNVQRIGRLLRPVPGKTARLWLVIASDTTDERLPDLVAGILR